MRMFGISERATRSKTLLERTVSDSHTDSYAQKPNEPERHHAFSAKRVVRTDANPTLATILRDTVLQTVWQPALDKELNMLRDLNVYDVVMRSEVNYRCQILQSKMDLKTKFLQKCR